MKKSTVHMLPHKFCGCGLDSTKCDQLDDTDEYEVENGGNKLDRETESCAETVIGKDCIR